RRCDLDPGEVDAVPRRAALQSTARTSMIDEPTPDRSRSGAVEVRAALEARLTVAEQAHVSLVDERGRLERVIGALRRHLAPCEHTQFGIEQRRELSSCVRTAGARVLEKAGEVLHGGSRSNAVPGVQE